MVATPGRRQPIRTQRQAAPTQRRRVIFNAPTVARPAGVLPMIRAPFSLPAVVAAICRGEVAFRRPLVSAILGRGGQNDASSC